MRRHYAVDGRLPKGKRFRGVVATTANGVVLSGPQCLCEKPWDKRPLTLPELRKLAKVEACSAPRLRASVEEHLECKCRDEEYSTVWVKRARFLQFTQDVREKLERDA